MCSQGIHCLYIEGEKLLSSQCGKSEKKIILQLYPNHMPSLIPWRITHAKFHYNWYKSVRRLAVTRGTHCLYIAGEKWLRYLYIAGEKWLSSQCGNIQTTCTSSYHEENTCKVSKRSIQNCKRSCAHNTPRVNVEERTDGWMNRWKLACLNHPLKQMRQ